jgi:chromosomal replication initiation ATPase DnaA
MKENLKEMIAAQKNRNMQNVLTAVSYVNSISEESIMDKSRIRPLVDARRFCYVLIREIYGYPYQTISGFFGKNHATIIHQLEVHKTLMKYDKHYSNNYIQIKNTLIDDTGFNSESILMKEKTYYLKKVEEINSKLMGNDKN